MFVIMSKAKYYALELLISSYEKRCDDLEKQLVRHEQHIRHTEDKLKKLEKAFNEISEEYKEAQEAAEKAERAFSEGVANILNYEGGGKK